MRKEYGNIIVFLITLSLLGSLNAFIASRPAVSQLENRVLKTRPEIDMAELFSGVYFRNYEEYFADNFIFREQMVRISRAIKEFRGIPGRESAYIVTHHGANVFQGKEQQAVDSAMQASVFVKGDKGMEIHRFNEEASSYYSEVINTFAAKVADDVQVYSMLVPTQIEYLAGEKYRKLSSPQKATIEYIDRNYASTVKPVNVYDVLQRHADEYIYFRTDHHWTALGAYWAYTEFIKSRGEEVIPLDWYEKAEIEYFLGSTYSTTLSESLKVNPDKVIYYLPFITHQYQVYYQTEPVTLELLALNDAKQTNKYGVFLGGDQPLGHIITNVKNNKRIVVIKDSYGNAFVPFLLPHYEEIYVLDPRLYDKDVYELLAKKDITEVLFLNYVMSMDNKGFAELLANRLSLTNLD